MSRRDSDRDRDRKNESSRGVNNPRQEPRERISWATWHELRVLKGGR
jgi:hypothetical protein